MSHSSTAAAAPSPASAVRRELDLKLQISGDLPDDLQGHVFIVGPVGTLSDPDNQTKNTVLNGDGIVYRLDFDRSKQVSLKSRLLKPFEYRIDEATHVDPRWSKLKFQDYGVVRFSKWLGFRNELNTAFLPMPGLDGQQRLLVTYDVGRPYLLDPKTLEVFSPIGLNGEWREAVKYPYPFKPIFSTAHPVFDSHTQEFFTVNYGRSLNNYLTSVPGLQFLNDILENYRHHSIYQQIVKILASRVQDFVYLLRWTGSGPLERWRLVLADGSPLVIEQTLHQIGITQDYVILMDTGFRAGLGQILRNPVLQRLMRVLPQSPPKPEAVLYFVKRRDLQPTPDITGESCEPATIVARRVIIPGEAAHFLVDYANPNQQITLHVSHICAWNVAEWIRTYDRSPRAGSEGSEPAPAPHSGQNQWAGQELNPMDISRFGRYIIDGNSNSEFPQQAKIVFDTRCTWGTGIYTYLDRDNHGMNPQNIENVYWVTFGLRRDLMTRFACRLYKRYRYQQIPQAEILKLVKYQDLPPCLLRLDTRTMEIADVYEFHQPYLFISSPQFIPRQIASVVVEDSVDPSTYGYLSCIVLHLNSQCNQIKRSEIWIFDSQDLEKGPLCKLHHPHLQLNSALHATWLPGLDCELGTYRISPDQDYSEIISGNPRPFSRQMTRLVRQLFSEMLNSLEIN